MRPPLAPLIALIWAISLGLYACERPERRATPEPASVTLGSIRAGTRGPIAIRRGQAEAQIETLAWVVSDIELHACLEQSASRALLLGALGVRDLHAHVPDSATRIGTPYVEDLLAKPGRAKVWGELAPPPLPYCALWVVIAPADEDVVNVSGLPTERLISHSFVMEGRYRSAPDQAWVPFSHALDDRLAAPVRFADPATGSARLELGPERRSAFILIEKTIDASLFEGIALDALITREGAREVLGALSGALSVYENKRARAPNQEESP